MPGGHSNIRGCAATTQKSRRFSVTDYVKKKVEIVGSFGEDDKNRSGIGGHHQ